MVSDIDGSVDLFKMDEIALDPFTKGKILNVNMAHARGGLLSIAHSRTAVIVLVGNGCGLLGNIEVP